MNIPRSFVIGLDPGTQNLGLAVLTEDGRLVHGAHLTPTCSTIAPYHFLTDPLARWHKLLCALVRVYAPTLIAYEDFVWRGEQLHLGADSSSGWRRTMGSNSPEMWGLIGVIRTLEGAHGQPTVLGYAPDWVCAELTGNPRADKMTKCRVVEHRLGEPIRQGYGAHQSDAIAVGLVALDHYLAARSIGIALTDYHVERRQWWRQQQTRRRMRRVV